MAMAMAIAMAMIRAAVVRMEAEHRAAESELKQELTILKERLKGYDAVENEVISFHFLEEKALLPRVICNP
jgi:hypothetical protein